MIDIKELRKYKRPQSAWVVHALLDRLEAAEKERDHEKWLRERAEDYSKAVEDQRDALHAKITEMEQQEPVAEWLPLDSGEDTRRD